MIEVFKWMYSYDKPIEYHRGVFYTALGMILFSSAVLLFGLNPAWIIAFATADMSIALIIGVGKTP